jgi:hypothetical protein
MQHPCTHRLLEEAMSPTDLFKFATEISLVVSCGHAALRRGLLLQKIPISSTGNIDNCRIPSRDVDSHVLVRNVLALL